MIIKASGQNIAIKLPKDYVGKQVEIMAFAADEV
jgi:hypothetical protein